jgi:hypothetical protein
VTIARVEQLIALACSTESVEEGRTAAMTAVRLMQKHGYRVTAKEDSHYSRIGRPAGRWTPPAPPAPTWVNWTTPQRPGGPPHAGRWDPEHLYEGPPRNPVRTRCAGCSRTIQQNERRFVGADGSFWCAAH